MKKLVLVLLAVVFFGCSDDSPTAPVNYPISYNNYAKNLAKIMNEERTKNGERNFTYIENVQIEYYDKTYDFIKETNSYNYPFSEEGTFEVRRNETNITLVTRHEFYLESLKNLEESIMNYDLSLPSWYNNFYNRDGFDETVSINIIEIGNNYPRTDEWGNEYKQFGKHRIIVFVYNSGKYIKQI